MDAVAFIKASSSSGDSTALHCLLPPSCWCWGDWTRGGVVEVQQHAHTHHPAQPQHIDPRVPSTCQPSWRPRRPPHLALRRSNPKSAHCARCVLLRSTHRTATARERTLRSRAKHHPSSAHRKRGRRARLGSSMMCVDGYGAGKLSCSELEPPKSCPSVAVGVVGRLDGGGRAQVADERTQRLDDGCREGSAAALWWCFRPIDRSTAVSPHAHPIPPPTRTGCQ